MSVLSLTIMVLLSLVIGEVSPCNTYGKTDGCSIPGDLPFFYKGAFRSACNRHDVCYACGYGSGVSRSVCDRRFYNNLLSRCQRESFWMRGFCRKIAEIYYNAVKHNGDEYYDVPSLSWCGSSWVPGCM
ncbi:uncharacterized protein LOC132728688 [Ruditapes philippinarum]|uniref:uncharacterized protein LOC132728688 n=1 Tax=Ruditapes philippinarum TaxID=129788 RepID=UPI00295B26F2|nr:uncharacterized protein LOC132728688 [Ruditapes philippinarum]